MCIAKVTWQPVIQEKIILMQYFITESVLMQDMMFSYP